MQRFFFYLEPLLTADGRVMQVRLFLWCFLMAALGWRFMTWMGRQLLASLYEELCALERRIAPSLA